MSLPAFLRDGKSALEWAMKNADIDISDDDEDDESESATIRGHERETYERRARLYSDFAYRIAGSGRLRVYRMICVPARSDVELHNLGKAWSSEKSGAGCYNSAGHKQKTTEILLTAEVSSKYVDWEYGFTSFMYYGEDQWEVSLDENAPLVVVAIDGEALKPGLRGNTGHAREEWSSRPKKRFR